MFGNRYFDHDMFELYPVLYHNFNYVHVSKCTQRLIGIRLHAADNEAVEVSIWSTSGVKHVEMNANEHLHGP